MADKSLDQSRTMMQAAESGMQGLQRASEYEGDQERQNFQQTMQLAQMAAGAIQSHQQSKQQQGQFESNQKAEAERFESGQKLTREQMAQRSSEFQQSQGLEREQLSQRSQQFTESQGLEREQMNQRAQQFTESQDLEAARSGLMRSQGQEQPQGPSYGPPEPANQRQQRLQQEMDRGSQQMQNMQGPPAPTPDDIRRQQQGDKPMEMNRSGRWVPTPEAERELQVKESLAESKRFEAISRRQYMASRANLALMKGDTGTYQAAAESSAKSVSGIGKAYDRMMDGKATGDDWDNLASEAKDLESLDPSAYAEIKSKRFTPRVQKLMRAGMMARSMEHIAQYGDDEGLYVDFASPQWKDYTERITMFSGIASSLGPDFAQFAGIRSLADKNRFLKRQAAMSMIYGMDQFKAADASGEGMVTGGEMSNLLQEGQPQLMGSMMPQQTATPATAPIQQQNQRTDNVK